MNRPPGRLWRTDDNGFILNDASLDQIPPTYRALVADAVRAYETHIGGDLDSIYLTGSVPRGLAVEGQSDLNTFAVLATGSDPELVLRDWMPAAEDALHAQHPIVSSVQLELWPYYAVFDDPRRFSIEAFIIKTHSACVWGVDLSTQLPDYRVSTAIANDDLVQVADDIADAHQAIAADPQAANVQAWCRFAAKALLRSAFGLMQMQEGVHTRDVDVCCRYAIRHFPEQADMLQQALNYTARPSTSASDALYFLDTAGRWIIAQAEDWLDQHNPDRALDLMIDEIDADE